MSVLIPEDQLPLTLSHEQAVEAAYARQLADATYDLQRGLPVLIECDKELSPYLYKSIRERLKAQQIRCMYLDGRPESHVAGSSAEAPGSESLGDSSSPIGRQPSGFVGTMLSQLADVVRGAVERRVVVLPHLDLLTTTQGTLSGEAREVIPLLYENPELVWLGFKDPSFRLPTVIEGLFPHHYSLLGVARDRLPRLVTRAEARKFGRQFNPWALPKAMGLSTASQGSRPLEPRE